VLRVRVDNPGMWHVHCHVHDHMMSGMQAVFATALDSLPSVSQEAQQWVFGTDKKGKNSASSRISLMTPLLLMLLTSIYQHL